MLVVPVIPMVPADIMVAVPVVLLRREVLVLVVLQLAEAGPLTYVLGQRHYLIA